jgi:hypothetical protein
MRSAFIGSDGVLPERASGLDVIIGTVGGEVLDAAYGLMRPGGRLVTLGAPPSEERAKSFGVHAMFFIVTPGPAELARLADLADNGKLRTAVSQTFPLRDGRPAFESRAQPRPQEDGPDRAVIATLIQAAQGRQYDQHGERSRRPEVRPACPAGGSCFDRMDGLGAVLQLWPVGATAMNSILKRQKSTRSAWLLAPLLAPEPLLDQPAPTPPPVCRHLS